MRPEADAVRVHSIGGGTGLRALPRTADTIGTANVPVCWLRVEMWTSRPTKASSRSGALMLGGGCSP